MSENNNPQAGYTDADEARVVDRAKLLLHMLRGDETAIALDALLSAYSTLAANSGRAAQAAFMLRRVADVFERLAAPQDLNTLVEGIPKQVHQVPMPARPPGPMPAGYADGDVQRIETLVATVLDLVEGEKGHNALSALLTCYLQISDHVGDSEKAARVLLSTGARVLARGAPPAAQAAAPVPTTTASLH